MKKNQKDIKKSLKIIPLGNRILIELDKFESKGEKKTDSGIFIPDNSSNNEKPEKGIVVAVGKGSYEDGKIIPIEVKVGDKVIFSKYSGDEIKFEEKKYLIIKEENILAILK